MISLNMFCSSLSSTNNFCTCLVYSDSIKLVLCIKCTGGKHLYISRRIVFYNKFSVCIKHSTNMKRSGQNVCMHCITHPPTHFRVPHQRAANTLFLMKKHICLHLFKLGLWLKFTWINGTHVSIAKLHCYFEYYCVSFLPWMKSYCS